MDPKANYLTLQILLLRVDIIPVLNKYNNTRFYNEEFLHVQPPNFIRWIKSSRKVSPQFKIEEKCLFSIIQIV